jgi:anti-anti-sigma factor
MGGVNLRATEEVVPGQPEFRAVVLGGHDGRIEIVVRGELDIAGTPALDTAVAPLLGLARLQVEVDARQLSFLDASGIGWFVKFRNLLRARGGDLVICSPSLQVQRLLGICGLTDLLATDPAQVSDRVLTRV